MSVNEEALHPNEYCVADVQSELVCPQKVYATVQVGAAGWKVCCKSEYILYSRRKVKCSSNSYRMI